LKTAILWPFVYKDHRANATWSWATRFQWLAEALIEEGFTVLQHSEFLCDIEGAKPYKGEKECDVVIYNHCDLTQIKGDIVKAKKTWIFKPTAPDNFQTTLDELGYGSYSSITYQKPDFENIPKEEVEAFFDTRVKNWLDKNTSKWGENHFSPIDLGKLDDYYLVLGQCGGDSVVNHQDFGAYFNKLRKITNYLIGLGDRHVVVKLHPYMNGKDYVKGKDKDVIREFITDYHSKRESVSVFGDFSSVHSFIPQAHSIITGNSGAAFEVMMHHKPIISFCYPEYHWVTYDLRKACDIWRAVKVEDWFDKEASDKFLYWYMDKYCFYDKESAKNRIRDLLA